MTEQKRAHKTKNQNTKGKVENSNGNEEQNAKENSQ